MINFAALIRHGSIFQELKNIFLCKESNLVYEQIFSRYILGILLLISLYLIALCFYPHVRTILFVGLVFNIYATISTIFSSVDMIKRMIPFYLILLMLYVFYLIVLTTNSWTSYMLTIYFLYIPLMLSPVYTWRTILKWMQFVFYFIIAAFVTFYLCKIKYSVFIDQDISVLSAQTTFIYDLGIIIFTFILLTYCLYYTYLFNKIRIKEVLQANGYDDKNFELNLTTHSMEYEKYKKIYRQIVTYLEEQALYLDPEFSSTRMAQDLNINISYLSKAIQLHSGMNFNRLVNSYRINKVKETLSTNLQSYTMQYIYMSSGFKSQSAFNKAFKMQEGITPSEYIKTLPN